MIGEKEEEERRRIRREDTREESEKVNPSQEDVISPASHDGIQDIKSSIQFGERLGARAMFKMDGGELAPVVLYLGGIRDSDIHNQAMDEG